MDVLSSTNTLGAVKAKQCKDQETVRRISKDLLLQLFPSERLECKAAFKAWHFSDTHKDDSGVVGIRGSRDLGTHRRRCQN